MTTTIVRRAKRLALAAGYDIREGCYNGTSDDVIGTWYVTHIEDNGYRPYGRGHATQGAAWLSAARVASALAYAHRLEG